VKSAEVLVAEDRDVLEAKYGKLSELSKPRFYDYASGKVKRTFDPNSRLYPTTYDALRRPLTVNEPDPSRAIAECW
jgi:hypothetical protein